MSGKNGHLQTAWNLVADVTVSDSGDLLGLAVAIGCLCRELDERDLDAYLAEDLDEDDDELFLWPEPDGPVH